MSLQSRLADLITALGADYKRQNGASATATVATFTPTLALKQHALTGLTQTVLINSPGAGFDGQSIILRIKDNGTIRTINWHADYRAIGVTLPTATVASKTLYLGIRYNAADSKWDVLAVGKEA